MATMNNLAMVTFNCRSIKNSMDEIRRLCDTHDFILIQEHWLLPYELNLLNNIHPDFLSHGLSAIDVTSDVLVGRPYGGTAILYRKAFVSSVKVINSLEPRICGLQVDTNLGPMLLLCVYMPTNYGDVDSYESYMDCLGKLHAIMVESDNIHVLIAGDFNCSPGSRFFGEFKSFSDDNNLSMSDMNHFGDVYTYISDDGLKMSWVDHVLTSNSIDNIISSFSILNDVIVSDHKPVSFHINCNISTNRAAASDEPVQSTSWVPCWQQCDANTLDAYKSRLDQLLCEVDVPWHLMADALDTCDISVIDIFYNDIISCMSVAVQDIIPVHKYSYSQFNVPGWTTYVKEKHDIAREAYLDWLWHGKPKMGILFENMKRSRATFKLALRYCKSHVDEMKADACAKNLMDKDSRKFWNSVYKISNSKATSHVSCIAGISGAENITEMWKVYFEKLYSAKAVSKYRSIFLNKLSNFPDRLCDALFTVQDIVSAMHKQKLNKAAGPDGLQAEAFIYGSHRLYVYLTVLFNLFVKCGYIPCDFCRAVIIPLVKNKNGNLTDVNNYRAIAISNSVSKLLEHVIMSHIESTDDADDYQFGFRKGISTGTCTQVLKETVHYYRQRGSHVFCCFVDFSKAFDNVDYWLLFCKLIDSNKSNSCLIAVRLLAYWYSHQLMSVRWQTHHSTCFGVTNGVRQGGVLSPFLFRVYIRDLIKSVVKSKIGCHIAGVCVNLLAYADDIVLLSPSWQGMQELLNVIEKAAIDIDMTFNTNKTVCMVANPYDKGSIVCQAFPQLRLANCNLSYVSQFKYLGHIIEHTFSDNSDIRRELKSLFARANVLIRRFAYCSLQVKLKLFRSYCLCFYDVALWSDFHMTVFNKLVSAYSKCMKMFFGFSKYGSVTGMLLQLGLPSFATVLHNARVSFSDRFCHSLGAVVRVIRLVRRGM